VRWPLVWIALCACKGDAPKTAPTVERVASRGPQRFPEVDAAIDAMRPALLLAEPTETVSACKGPLEVVAIDHEAALLIAAGRPAPQGAQLTTPPEIASVVRYASKSTLSQEDVAAIQTWAKARPASFVWGFLDGATVNGAYEGVLHVIDTKTRAVLCHTPIKAPSSDRFQIVKALSDKLALLRAGTDEVTLPDPATDNRGPPLEVRLITDGPTWHCSRIDFERRSTRCYRDKAACADFYGRNEVLGYEKCSTQGTAVCFTYRDLAAEKDAFSCHMTMESCIHNRNATKTDPDHPASEVSACTEVGGAMKP
jgi:hypothetical protein